jgi:hypothetical protein
MWNFIGLFIVSMLGFKNCDRIAVFGLQLYSQRLLSASSIFSAESNAILLALKFIASSECKLTNCTKYILFLARLRVLTVKSQ